MRINRLAMLAAVDKAISNEAAAIESAKARAEQLQQERVQEWVEKNRQPWLDAIKKIQARLRKGEAVQEADVPYDRTSRSNGPAVWRNRPSPVQVPQRDTTLPGLRTLLDAIVDDTVTTSSLRDLGVTPRTLQNIVPLLGAHTATANRKAAV